MYTAAASNAVQVLFGNLAATDCSIVSTSSNITSLGYYAASNAIQTSSGNLTSTSCSIVSTSSNISSVAFFAVSNGLQSASTQTHSNPYVALVNFLVIGIDVEEGEWSRICGGSTFLASGAKKSLISSVSGAARCACAVIMSAPLLRGLPLLRCIQGCECTRQCSTGPPGYWSPTTTGSVPATATRSFSVSSGSLSETLSDSLFCSYFAEQSACLGSSSCHWCRPPASGYGALCTMVEDPCPPLGCFGYGADPMSCPAACQRGCPALNGQAAVPLGSMCSATCDCYQVPVGNTLCNTQVVGGQCQFCPRWKSCGPKARGCSCSAIPASAECEAAFGGECEFSNGKCLDGACFSFLIHGYRAQPYLLFLLAAVKDVVLLLLVNAFGPAVSLWLLQLRHRRTVTSFFLTSSVHHESSATGIQLDDCAGVNEDEGEFSWIASSRPLDYCRMLIDATCGSSSSADAAASLTQPAADDSLLEGSADPPKDRYDSAVILLAKLKAINIYIPLGATELGRAGDHTAACAASCEEQVKWLVREFGAHPAMWSTSPSISERVRLTVDTFVGSVVLRFLVAMQFVSIGIYIYDADYLLTEYSLSPPLTEYIQVVTFRMANSGTIVTASLLLVKLFSLLVASATREESLSVVHAVTVATLRTNSTVRASTAVYLLLCSPMLMQSLAGCVLYPFVPAGAALVAAASFHAGKRLRHLTSLKFGVLNFMLEQQIPTLLLAVVLQSTFNYFLMFTNQAYFSLSMPDGYFDVIVKEYQSRLLQCLESIIRRDVGDIQRTPGQMWQIFSSTIPGT
jgi:hypothetical protein